MRIRTKNHELYSKINMLNFSNEVVINNIDSKALSRIVRNINRNEIIVNVENISDHRVIMKKTKPFSFNVYKEKL